MDRYTDSVAAHSTRRDVGIVCLGLGFVGLWLPLVPGIPLLIVGSLLLRNRGTAQRHFESYSAARDFDVDAVVGRRQRRFRELSGMELLQLRFWTVCRAITTRLDPHPRSALTVRYDSRR